MYRDSQTDGVMEKAFSKVPRAEIFEATGIQFLGINSLYQLLAISQRNRPLLDLADKMLFIPDLFNHFFTGEKVAEFSIATTSQMYDPRKKTGPARCLRGSSCPRIFFLRSFLREHD